MQKIIDEFTLLVILTSIGVLSLVDFIKSAWFPIVSLTLKSKFVVELVLIQNP